MSKKPKKGNILSKKFRHIKTVGEISEYRLDQNGLTVLYKQIRDTGVVTTNITYLVGARDEQVGETGVAHMLEHMLFKPTKQDRKRKSDSAAMNFERETGAILNANTWKDRTTYYFSYGVEHFARVLQIEAERMRDVELTNKEFLPERANVLSEFDMYNGDPHFALSVAMNGAAFLSHPYGHETIGFREDISAYTVEKLQKFYNQFYCPNNAVLMVVGDISLEKTLQAVYTAFSELVPEPTALVREIITEPVQEGVRRTEISRAGTTNILSLGVKHPGFIDVGWYETMAALKILAEGSDCVLHKKLVDTGLASNISYSQNPVKDTDLATINITLTTKTSHAKMETLVRKIIAEVDELLIKKHLKNIVTKAISDEIFSRDSSLNIAAELTEYVSAGKWEAYFETEKTLRSLTAKQVESRLHDLFKENSLTIGNYKSI